MFYEECLAFTEDQRKAPTASAGHTELADRLREALLKYNGFSPPVSAFAVFSST